MTDSFYCVQVINPQPYGNWCNPSDGNLKQILQATNDWPEKSFSSMSTIDIKPSPVMDFRQVSYEFFVFVIFGALIGSGHLSELKA